MKKTKYKITPAVAKHITQSRLFLELLNKAKADHKKSYTLAVRAEKEARRLANTLPPRDKQLMLQKLASVTSKRVALR
jgi:hypothetical protein